MYCRAIKEVWGYYDPKGTGFMPKKSLKQFFKVFKRVFKQMTVRRIHWNYTLCVWGKNQARKLSVLVLTLIKQWTNL